MHDARGIANLQSIASIMGANASRPFNRQDRNEPVPPPQPRAPAAHDSALLNGEADAVRQIEPGEAERQNSEPAEEQIDIDLQQEMLLYWNGLKQQEHNDRVVVQGIAAGEADNIAVADIEESVAPKTVPASEPTHHLKKKLSHERNRKTGACCVKSVTVGKDSSGATIHGKSTTVKGTNKMSALILYLTT